MASRRLRAFKRWMKSQGIVCDDALELEDSPGQGIYVKALCGLKEGAVVAKIPKSACLTIINSGAREIIESACFDGCLGLSVAVMYEKSLGEESPWAGYLHLLADQECLPLVWSLDEVDSLLRGTELHKVTKEDKVLIYEDWKENILPLIESPNLKLDPSFFGVEQYFAAKSLVASRSFEIDDNHGYGMVPLADLFNHKTGAEDVHFTSMPSPSDSDNGSGDDDTNMHEDSIDDESQLENSFSAEQVLNGVPNDTAKCGVDQESSSDLQGDASMLEMVMVKDVEAGAEVFNTYGLLGNAALLHRYGFTEDDNPYDIVNIDLELVLQWSSAKFSRRYSRGRFSSWRRLDYCGCVSQNSEYFEVSYEGEPQTELLILLYIMLLAEDAYYELDHAVSTVNNKDGSRGRGLPGKLGTIVCNNLEVSKEFLLTKGVRRALVELAQERERLYGSNSISDDIEALKRCCRVKERKLYHSLVLRVSERRILGKLRNYAKGRTSSGRPAVDGSRGRKRLKRT